MSTAGRAIITSAGKGKFQVVRICPGRLSRAVFQDPEVIFFHFSFCLSSDISSRTATKSCKGKVEIQAETGDRRPRRGDQGLKRCEGFSLVQW
jgi:hypothetical protein